MRIGNVEFGLTRDELWRVRSFYIFARSECCEGCILFDAGPFYFTILKGRCK